jgi:hypothetical protein
LKRIKTNVIGVVLNEVREDMSDRYYLNYARAWPQITRGAPEVRIGLVCSEDQLQPGLF